MLSMHAETGSLYAFVGDSWWTRDSKFQDGDVVICVKAGCEQKLEGALFLTRFGVQYLSRLAMLEKL